MLGGRPKNESTLLIEKLVKSPEYQKYFMDDGGIFFIPRQFEFKFEDNIFDKIMNEPSLANFNLSVGAIANILKRNKKAIKGHFETVNKEKLKAVQKYGTLGSCKKAKTIAVHDLVVTKYAHILHNPQPSRKDVVYTAILNEPEIQAYKDDLTEETIFFMVKNHAQFLRNKSK